MESNKAVTVSGQYPVEQIERMAHAFAKSGLFGIYGTETVKAAIMGKLS